jgi:hypothetical protein
MKPRAVKAAASFLDVEARYRPRRESCYRLANSIPFVTALMEVRHPNRILPRRLSEAQFVIVEMHGYQRLQLFLSCLLKMISINPAKREMEKLMKRAALVLLMIGSLTVAGQASAHGHGGGHRGGGGDGGAIVGALIGGAVLGALVTSVASAQPTYAQPVYQQPAYAQPVYAQPAQPPGYCYDNYRGAYVPCGY